ncbi:aminotransferase, class V [Leptospira ryugenii]|uniref:Aminotransferase, class V n=2 Tax=Leptospira ryugenii TaxID=1917863 RepID=A0A2P2E564_9LEPT|nr:aminotransferase, class V [Leptospira ryugenii]
MDDFFEEYSKFGIYAPNFTEAKVKAEIRTLLAPILGCEAHQIGLVHNTSEGMNLYSHSINLPKGSRILVLENEYPSNVYPWEHWQSKGVDLTFVQLGTTPEEFSNLLEIEFKSGRVSLLSISPVHWCTGMPILMEDVARLCKKFNVRLVIDGSQSVGHQVSKLSEWNVEFAVFAAWKWLLGPLGLGIVYVSDSLSENFELIFKGAGSVKNDSQYLPYRKERKAAADQFEHSTANFNDWVYFLASLHMLNQITYPKVYERIYDISNQLQTMLRGLGYLLDSDFFPNHSTGIIAIRGRKNGEEFRPEELQLFLKTKKIFTVVRLGRLRIAPHIPVTEEHIERLERALREYGAR